MKITRKKTITRPQKRKGVIHRMREKFQLGQTFLPKKIEIYFKIQFLLNLFYSFFLSVKPDKPHIKFESTDEHYMCYRTNIKDI